MRWLSVCSVAIIVGGTMVAVTEAQTRAHFTGSGSVIVGVVAKLKSVMLKVMAEGTGKKMNGKKEKERRKEERK